MSGIHQMMLGGGGSPVAALGLISVNSNGSSVTASARFNTDGSITYTQTGGSSSGPANWFNPPGGTPGNNYWIRCTVSTGSLTVNQAVTFQPLSSNRSFSSTSSGLNPSGGTGTFEIAADAAGTIIVSTGTWSITCN